MSIFKTKASSVLVSKLKIVLIITLFQGMGVGAGVGGAAGGGMAPQQVQQPGMTTIFNSNSCKSNLN